MQTRKGSNEPQNLTKTLVVSDPYISEPRRTQSISNIHRSSSLTKVQIHYIVPTIHAVF